MEQTERGLSLPAWEELPALELYLDQVITVLEEALRPSLPGGEAVITATIINNYVKQKVLPPTVKKKYSRAHLADLLVLTLLKRALSTQEMAAVLAELKAGRSEEAAYGLFRRELTAALSGESGGADCPPLAAAAVRALAGKLAFQWQLAARTPPAPEKKGRGKR